MRATAALLAGALVACGPSPPPEAPPPPPPPSAAPPSPGMSPPEVTKARPPATPDPAELEALERDLRTTERAIVKHLQRRRTEPARKLEKKSQDDDGVPRHAHRGSACDLACRALKSMRFAGERICVLAGKDSTRCQNARGRIRRAKSRIDRGGCRCFDRNIRVSHRGGGAAPEAAQRPL